AASSDRRQFVEKASDRVPHRRTATEVVVVGARNFDPALLPCPRIVERARTRRRNEAVAAAADGEQRRRNAPGGRMYIEAMAQQPVDRQPGVVHAPEGDETVERRDQ